jgi:hypothetical protein
MIPFPHHINKAVLHFLHHLPLKYEVLLLVAIAVVAFTILSIISLFILHLCRRNRGTDEDEVEDLPTIKSVMARFWSPRRPPVRQFSTVEDFLMEVESKERGRVAQPTEPDIEASLDSVFPDILQNHQKKERRRPRRATNTSEQPTDGEQEDRDEAEQPLL